ncbi:hypothetical protein [Tautonia sociabilis]|uniref:Uncharacterized protein n=1 Tax=Tautonia sociabilis TaxID=2080755 RepID=A0A432MK79_9BACT|nr:hypothetical protein [Tautonia sociabilis]RUL87813.1 hypothetical protein TsocGM_10670 [Tautonia sociabilis]
MLASQSAQPPSLAEQALLVAFRAFGAWPDDPAWSRLGPSWRARLEPERRAIGDQLDAGAARAQLCREHAAEARADPARIHPSWYVRALKREATAIRRAVAAAGPLPPGAGLRRGLGYVDEGPSFSHPPHPEALAWALVLAGERLVGGPIRREDDPTLVRAISALDSRGHYHLLSALGLAKLAFANEAGPLRSRARTRTRIRVIEPSLPAPRLELVDLALADIRAARSEGGGRHLPPRLGLVSAGRLLADADPHRARWTLQHLPYDVARLIGVHMASPAPSPGRRAVLAWEEALLRAAIVLLIREGRFDPTALADPGRGTGGRP